MCVKKGREYHRYRKKRKEGVRTGVFSKPDYKSRRMVFKGVCVCLRVMSWDPSPQTVSHSTGELRQAKWLPISDSATGKKTL